MKARIKLALELERLRRKNLQALHPLEQLFWESTLRCNVHCRHCGSDCTSSVTTEDMPLADFLKVIDEEVTPHVDPHKVMIIVSGGEPMMRKDLPEIGMALKQRGYPWGMVTNGVALTPERFRTLRNAGLCSMAVSLDGMEDDHVWLRQHPLAFSCATRAIRMAAEEGMTFDVVTCVNKRNLHRLAEVRDLLLSLGCHHWRCVSVDPMGRAADDPELLLDAAELKQLMEFIRDTRNHPELQMHVSYGCPGFLGDFEGEVRDHLYQCAAGIRVASILIDGSVSACTSIRGKYYQGNIYKEHFWDIWENRFENYRDRSWMRKMAPCNDCKMWRYCEGNGMHLRREDGTLMRCHYNELNS